jgi:NAD(P)-dependent dehydrogenase (short-subunit alcohol dehydrogenase family)
MAKAIVVTGGNQGIGAALVQQLLSDHGCRVFMGSRDVARGEAAVAAMDLPADVKARCSVVQIDVSDDASVAAAAKTVGTALDGAPLYALVNNAGAGLAQASVTPDMVVNTNFYGPKRMSDAFAPLLDPAKGRIVNLGSGAAGMFVKKLGETDEARALCKGDLTWDELDAYVKSKVADGSLEGMTFYGMTKAALAAYTQFYAKQNPAILCSCVSPGFIDTAMTAGFGASKTPAEGTPAIKKLLFEPLDGSGFYYGSDGIRSPYHFMRNPGEPAYDGNVPF